MPHGVYEHKPHSEETKAKQRVTKKKYYRDHPWIQKEWQNTFVALANHSAGQIKRYEDPDERAKISVALIKHNKEHPGAHMGEKNGNWQKGIGSLPYPFEFSAKFKEQVHKRYNHTCMICRRTQAQVGSRLVVHHIDYDKDNLDPDNFVLLCNSCHGKTVGKKNRTYWTEVLQTMVEMNKVGATQNKCSQLIERANKWLEEKGKGPLNPHEIIYITKKMADATNECSSVSELEMNLALCVSKAVCKFRGYAIPTEQ